MSIGPAIALSNSNTLPNTSILSIGPAVANSSIQLLYSLNRCMGNTTLRIEKTRGYTASSDSLMRVPCDIYSVIYHGKIVIRTSNRRTAYHYYALYSEHTP